MCPQSHDHDQVAGPGPQSSHVKYPGLASSSQGVTERSGWIAHLIAIMNNKYEAFITRVVLFCHKLI